MVFVQLYLWIAPHLLLAVCLAKVLRLRLHQEFPVFVSYVVFEEAQFAISFIVYLLVIRSLCSVATYRWFLVTATLVSGVLQLASVYEISAALVMRRSPLARMWWPLLRWATALFVLLAGTVSGLISQPGIQRAGNAFEVLNFSANVINIGVLVVLLAFSSLFHVTWRSLAAGFVLGFGINSGLEMAATALMASMGSRGYIAMDVIRMVGFHTCVLIWLVYVFRRKKSVQVIGHGLSRVDLELWNDELQRLVK